MSEYKVVNSELIYDGKILKVIKDEIEFENGQIGTREKIEHPGAVAIALVDENNQFYMVEQYRHGTCSNMLEFVAGKKEIGEDSFKCATREVVEETGYTGKDYIFLGSLVPTGAYLSEVIDMYFARADKYVGQNLDEDEFITIHKYSLDEIIEKIMNNEISDSKTIAMAFKIKEKIKRKEIVL